MCKIKIFEKILEKSVEQRDSQFKISEINSSKYSLNFFLETKLAGNSDGYVHMLMLQVEKDRANNRKCGILDLNILNKQYTLFQQHEKQVLLQQQQQQQQQQQIKIEQQSYDDQGMDESTGGFLFNENTISPQSSLQFWL